MYFIVIVTLVLITLLTGLFYFYSKWRHQAWTRLNVPQLDPEFIFGNSRPLLRRQKSIGEFFLDMYKELRAKGWKYAGIYFVNGKVFVPVDPDVIKAILQKDFEYFTGHFPTKMLPKTLFTKTVFHLDGDEWRWMRKQLSPTFTSGKIKMMYETIVEKTAGFEKLIGQHATDKEPANIKELLNRFTIEIIASVGFGIDCDAMEDPDCEFIEQGRMITNPPKRSMFWVMFWKFLGVETMPPAFLEAEKFFKVMVENNVNYREKNKVYRKDFIHLMIQLKNRGKVSDDIDDVFTKLDNLPIKFDIDEMTAQALLFYLAGFETSATTLTFAIYELTYHPEIQEKIREEANRVIEKYGGKLTYDGVMELTYSKQVIEETLRMHPPLPAIPRACTKTYTIPGTNSVIEKDTTVFIPAWGLHMDPEYFPDPEKFDPERFSAENKKNIRDFTYLPFGEGPRLCLGLRFAYVQTLVGLVSLLRRHQYTLNKKTAVPYVLVKDNLIAGVEGGVWVDIHKVGN